MLIKLGFMSSELNSYIYINKIRQLIMLVYVDDISIALLSKLQI